MKFYKVHGLGNDFVLFDGRFEQDVDWNALAAQVADRHTGIGADGTLILLDSEVADVRMRVINADGSEAEMSGNGIRALSRYAFENGIVRGTEFTVETGAGIMKPRILLKNGRVDGVRVDMGEPLLDPKDIPVVSEGRAMGFTLTANGRAFLCSSLRVGVPHTIVFSDPLVEADVPVYGALIERDPKFPKHTNVDFVQVLSDKRVRLRSWVRGCGCTLASGTGACAAAVACVLAGKTGRTVAVEFERGALLSEWSPADNHVYMTGPTEVVFSGIRNN